MLGYIYRITNLVTGKCYIGQTDNIQRRWSRHRKDYLTKNSKLYSSVRKHGIENFEFSVVFVALDVDDLNEFEEYFVSVYDSCNRGYNATFGGGGCRGFNQSEDTKRRMSEYKKHTNPQKGKPISQEHKEKLSVLFSGENNPFYGKKHTEESLRKISLVHKGKVISEETLKKYSARSSGENNPMFGSTRPEVGAKNVETKGYKIKYNGVVYPSMRIMAEQICKSRKTISKMILSGEATKV